MLWFKNYDLDNIFTPVNAKVFGNLLRNSGYLKEKVHFIESGFSSGFLLHYQGPEVTHTAPNLKLRIGSKLELWNKVMKEVGEKRFAGPYEKVPFDNYIQSPIGLVPKDGGRKTRLIFHLSYPKNGSTSVNACIPTDKCKVAYPDFEEAVRMCLEAGVNCKIGKSDMASAFRHVPLKISDFKYLVMKAEHPISKRLYYFIDKCLPFGSSISCSHFQAVSDAIAHIVSFRNKSKTLNYLDDFFFAALWKWLCDKCLQMFLDICNEINFPVAMEKTFWGTTFLTFLGLLLDTERQLVCVPKEKVNKALELIDQFLGKRRKATVLQVQQLCGYLNFLCRAIVPGRAFTMRLYATLTGLGNKRLLPHHHIKIREIDLICKFGSHFCPAQRFFADHS